MSGARLETGGQVRGVAPFLVTEMLTAAPAFGGTVSVPLTSNKRLPFGIGPDKSGRVYPCINGLSIILTADSYVGTPTIVGTLQWRDDSGAYVLAAIAQVLTAPIAINHVNLRIIPAMPYYADAVNKIGSIEFVNLASALGGTATAITATCYINMGYYGDYGEQDGCCDHHEQMTTHLYQLVRHARGIE